MYFVLTYKTGSIELWVPYILVLENSLNDLFKYNEKRYIVNKWSLLINLNKDDSFSFHL